MESISAEFFKALDFIADHFDYVANLTILLTVIVLAVSTKYAINNIFRLWTKGEPDRSTAVEDEDHRQDDDDGIVKSRDLDWSMQQGTDTSAFGDAGPDPVQFCEHLQSEVKKIKQKVATREIQQSLTEEDMENEREIQRKQLEQIFKLMEQQDDKFGVSSVDDINHQMKLYA